MTYQASNFNQFQELSVNFSAQQKQFFLKTFWLVSVLSFCIIVTSQASIISIVSALLIAIAALYPSYLWCRDRAKGLPLFPLLAINFLFTHSFPLITDNLKVQEYSPTEHLISAFIVVTFLGVATVTWLSYVKKVPYYFSRVKEFSNQQIFPFFIGVLILRIIYQINSNSGYLWLIFPDPMVSAMRVITGGLSSFAVITLGYLLGKKLINKNQSMIFLITMAILLFVSGVTLYLNTFGFYILFASIGWMLGSKKVPWKILIVVFLIIAFLNLGKGTTRKYYWGLRTPVIQPSEYTQVYQKWIDNSLAVIKQPNDKYLLEEEIVEDKDQDGSIINRSSVVQMLLKIQSETSAEKPHLWGKTYFIIPQLLVPRFLNPDKIRGGEANHILSVYYGLQTYRQTLTTSIGWGLLQEAYANFSWLGCIGLGVFLGSLYGWVTRWSMNASTLSFRFLVALIFIILAFRVEITMGIFISVILQSLVILSAIRLFLMKTKIQKSIT